MLRAVFALPDSGNLDHANPFTWNYRPTTALIVNVLFRLFGVSVPAGYHAALVLGHLAASALAGLLAARLTGHAWVGVGVTAAFGLHFASVETVAWFGSIAEVTAAVLGLAAIVSFLRFRESGARRWASLAVICYALALGSNSTAAPVIGVIGVLDFWRVASGKKVSLRACWPYLPLGALAVAYLVIESSALRVASGSGGYGYSLGAHAVLNALWYPVVLIAPFTEPELFDFHAVVQRWLAGEVALSAVVETPRGAPLLLAHVVVLVAAVWVALRGPGWARAAVAGGLLLESPFVLLGGTMFHFAYLPAVFFVTLGVAAAVRATSRPATSSRGAAALAATPVVLAAVLMAWQTHGRIGAWEFAAGLSHRIVLSAHDAVPDPEPNAVIITSGLPNTISGAYVFREGFQAALRVTYGQPNLVAQAFSRPIFDRIHAETDADDARVFLLYDPEVMELRLYRAG